MIKGVVMLNSITSVFILLFIGLMPSSLKKEMMIMKAEFYSSTCYGVGIDRREISLYREQEIEVVPQVGTTIIFENENGKNGSVFVDKVDTHINEEGRVVKIVIYDDFGIKARESTCLKGKDKETTEKLLREDPELLGVHFRGWEISSVSGYGFPIV